MPLERFVREGERLRLETPDPAPWPDEAGALDDQGRSHVAGCNQGALQLYAGCSSGRFLGAEMFGPAAERLGRLLAWSVQRGDTVQQMLDGPYHHPVIEAGLRTGLRQLQRARCWGRRRWRAAWTAGPGPDRQRDPHPPSPAPMRAALPLLAAGGRHRRAGAADTAGPVARIDTGPAARHRAA